MIISIFFYEQSNRQKKVVFLLLTLALLYQRLFKYIF